MYSNIQIKNTNNTSSNIIGIGFTHYFIENQKKIAPRLFLVKSLVMINRQLYMYLDNRIREEGDCNLYHYNHASCRMKRARPYPHAKITEAEATGPPRDAPPALQGNPSKPVPAISPRQAETARYIAAMSGEMAAMANGAGLKLVAHFLAMAKAEAENEAERAA